MQESEARIDSLRQKKGFSAAATSTSSTTQDDSEPGQNNAFPADQHIDLFADFKEKITTAKPMDEEKRKEQEKYEKQIGYLTYLGQDTHEALGTRSWYDQAPKRSQKEDEDVEVSFKAKQRLDPMRIFAQHTEHHAKLVKSQEKASLTKPATVTSPAEPPTITKSLKYTPLMPPSVRRNRDESDEDRSPKRKKKKKHKDKDRHSKDEKKKKKSKRKKEGRERSRSSQRGSDTRKQESDSLALLREKRLRREAEEKLRVYELLHGKPTPSTTSSQPTEAKAPEAAPVPYVKQKYNSQFNPVLAKQNYN